RVPEPRPQRERKREGEREPGAQNRSQELLGLFAYHRDAPLVARAPGVPMSDLVAERESPKIPPKRFPLPPAPHPALPHAPPRAPRPRAPEPRVAAELQTTAAALRRIAAERGLPRELESVRDRLRRDARRRKWPEERLEQVLHRRDELRELDILDELDREVAA